MDHPPKPPTPHSWLEKLELDSWQAELVISGIAIYGSLQLPTLIEQGVNQVIISMGDAFQGSFYFVFWYLLLAATVFIISFIGHLILRSLWIGLVGLASVFPKGINLEAKKYGRNYLERASEDFGDIREFNKKLDELCSLVFALTFSIAFSMIAIAIQMLIGLALASIAVRFFPGLSPTTIFIYYMVLIFLPSILGGFLGLPSLRDKAWVQKIHYPVFTRGFGQVIFLFFFRPVTLINLTLYTNLKTQNLFTVFGSFFLVALVVGALFLIRSNTVLLMDTVFFPYTERADRMLPQNYANSNQKPVQLTPEMEGDVLREPLIRLFVPVLGRDETYLTQFCGKYQDDPKRSEDENLEAARAFRTDCLRRYMRLYLDNAPIEADALIKYRHPRGEVPGVLMYIPLDSLPRGQHLLRIEYEYRNGEGKQRKSSLPFYYQPK